MTFVLLLLLLLLSDDRSCTGLFALLYCLPQHLGLVHVRSQALFLSFLLLGGKGGEGLRFKKSTPSKGARRQRYSTGRLRTEM